MMEDQILLEAVKEIEDDFALAEAADLIERQLAYREQIGGSAIPLLSFELRPVGGRRNWRNLLIRQHYVANINQLQEPNANDNLGIELTSALHRSIQRQINQDPSLSEHSTIHFALQSDAFTPAFQSVTFSV